MPARPSAEMGFCFQLGLKTGPQWGYNQNLLYRDPLLQGVTVLRVKNVFPLKHLLLILTQCALAFDTTAMGKWSWLSAQSIPVIISCQFTTQPPLLQGTTSNLTDLLTYLKSSNPGNTLVNLLCSFRSASTSFLEWQSELSIIFLVFRKVAA